MHSQRDETVSRKAGDGLPSEQDAKRRAAVAARGSLLPAAEWVSIDEAADQLGVSPRKVRWLIGGNHLTRARNDADEAGVARESVAREAEWRRTASRWSKLKRGLEDTLDMISP